MASLVLLETTFWTGSADINLALTKTLNTRRHSGKMTGLPGLTRRLKYYYPVPPELHLDQQDGGLAVTIRLPDSSR